MKKKEYLSICTIAMACCININAQCAIGTDIVSSYVWRGIQQEGSKDTPNIQPYISYTIYGFTIGSWASSSFIGNVKEIDLYASYAFSSALSVTITDYNWGFSHPKGYFYYGKGTDHYFEGTLTYTGPESFPLGVSVNTMFAGSDTLSTGKAAFSTYTELSYTPTTNVKVFCGASVFQSQNVYNTSGFAITNIGVKLSKNISITDKFSLPVYATIGTNLSKKNYDRTNKTNSIYFVAGITL